MAEFSLKSLKGHDLIKERLKSLYLQGVASGSYLFSGMESTGKKMTALWYAQLVSCKSDDKPCGACVSCRKIEKGLHPDVKLIEKEADKTVITIDRVRQDVISDAGYKPFEGSFRVFVINDAHLLNDQSQNALLKVLEEPGPQVIIILVTSRLAELFPTVLSRCREIKFSPLPPEKVSEILTGMPDVPGDLRQTLAAFSAGSPGRAIRLARSKDFLKIRSSLIEILLKLPDGKLQDVLDFADSFRIARQEVESLELTFEIILSFFRDILVIQSGLSNAPLINADYYTSIQDVSFCFGPEDVTEIIDLLLEIRKQTFENNLNLKFGLQRFLIKVRQLGSVSI